MKFILNYIRLLFKQAQTDLMYICLLGLISGIFAAVVIVLFRYIIEQTQSYFLPGNDPENYEELVWYLIFLLPLIGGALIGLIFHFIPADKRQVGIVHTLEELQYHQGRLPFINFVAQFIGASISIIFGHSVGREGPSVHLGASSGSYVAYLLNLPDQTRRTLLACGAAAAIAASFNTPLAGVIFALEVIMLEYTVLSMMPIIIASLTATLISHLVFGNQAALSAPALGQIENSEIPAIIFCGIIIGLISVAFNRMLLTTTARTKHAPIFWRLTIAGGITGLLGLAAPEILSIGYDTVSATFHNEIALSALLLILLLKLIATSIGLGLGLPGGLIGPTLVIGALAGAAVGTIMQIIFPESTTSPGMYAMIGMGAMMGATLQAPLAALMAIFELTLNPHIILPGLLTIVVASLTASEILKQPSIFVSLMRARALDKSDELETSLLKKGNINDILDQKFIIIPQLVESQIVQQAIAQNIRWLVIRNDEEIQSIIPIQSILLDDIKDQIVLNLNDEQYQHIKVAKLPENSNLLSAKQLLQEHDIGALYVEKTSDLTAKPILGILSREDMSNYTMLNLK